MRLDPILLRHLPKDKGRSILDIGCGDGKLLHELRRRGYRLLTGVDKHEYKLVGEASFLQSDVTDDTGFFAYNDFFYCCIIMWDVLEHIHKKDVRRLLRRCRETLSQNGMLILHLPNAEGLFGSRILHSDLTHRWAYTPQLITKLLKEAGFREVTCYPCMPIIHGPISACRWILCSWLAVLHWIMLAAETGTTDNIWSQNMIVVAKKC